MHTSKHALRAKARKLNIDIKILQKQLASVEACLRDDHITIHSTCIVCGATNKGA